MSSPPSMHLGSEGLIVGWSSPIGPAVARFETWKREAPVFARTLGNPGLDRPVAPLVWPVAGHLVVIWCEDEGALSATLSRDGTSAAEATLVVPGARSIALARGAERATLFASDEDGIVRVDLDERGAPLGAPRRSVSVRRAGAVLSAARVRDEALLVFAHRGEAILGVVATRGSDEVAVQHPLRAPCDDLSVHAAAGRAAVVLERGGALRLGLLGSQGRLIERPRPVLERSGMSLGSAHALWTDDHFTLLAHERDADRLLVRPLAPREGEGFALPRCQGAFAAAYWAQSFFALEVTPESDGGELRLWRCAKDGGEPQQRVTQLVLDDASRRRARLAARHTLILLAARLGRSTYQGAAEREMSYRDTAFRDASMHGELARDGGSVTLLDAEGRLTVGLAPDDTVVRLRVESGLGDDPRLPGAASSLVRLARWINHRLSADARAEVARDVAFGEERAGALGGTLIRVERAGAALVLELALAALPDVDALEPWVRALREAHRAFPRA